MGGAASGSADPSVEGGTRARVVAELRRRIEEAGGSITLSVAKVAGELGVTVETLRRHLKGLVDSGEIVKLRAGLEGTTLALPGMRPGPAEAEAAAEAPRRATVADAEPAATMAPAAGEPPAEEAASASLRSRILELVREAVRRGRGEATLSAVEVARTVGTTASAAAYHIRRLAAAGSIQTENAGRAGLRIRLGTGRATPRAVRRGARGASFCPWCGQRMEGSWRFCPRCGKAVPRG